MLAAMGAEVIKVESSTRPEYTNRGGWFAITNNTKRSHTIDITEPAGQELVHRLVAISDVVVENFSASVLEKYRLGYGHLRAVRADLIWSMPKRSSRRRACPRRGRDTPGTWWRIRTSSSAGCSRSCRTARAPPRYPGWTPRGGGDGSRPRPDSAPTTTTCSGSFSA